MWKLELAKKRNEQLKSALIFGTPGLSEITLSEITLSDKQRVLLVANIAELAQEAKEKHILFRDVHSAAEAASAVIAMA
jgi:Holliday junction resolvasome RuvABC ATP-dependent DNA helicase subunit